MLEPVPSQGMIRLAAMILLAVELGGGFGTAAASVVLTTQQSMVIDLHVEVVVSADSVVAHLALPGEDTVTIPLLPRGDGTYGVSTELKRADYQVAFEALGEVGAQSQPVPLTSLGIDLGSGEGTTPSTEADEGHSPATQRWLWLGVALGGASLSALAFWVLGGRDDDPDGDHVEDQGPPENSSSSP
jgi:hypothetical protein